MRALNPSTTGSSNPKLQPNTRKSSQQNQSPPDSRTTNDNARKPFQPLNSTAKPPSTSRQPTVSSIPSTSGHINTKTNIKRLASSESLTHRTTRPTIISATVTRTPRFAASTSSSSNSNSTARFSTTTSKKAASSPPTVSSADSAVSPSLADSRTPLRPQDQNARLLTRPSPSMSKSVRVTMPYDRSPNVNGGRPLLPTLSASAARGKNKTPITPKIAAKTSQAPALGANAHTPLPKRTHRPESGLSIASGLPRNGTQQDDELPSYLHNITPRSGTRQSRVDSANSTPNGTPSQERIDGWDKDGRSGLGISPSVYDGDFTRRPTVAFSSITADFNGQAKREAQNDTESKFFYASDAKSTQQPPPKPILAKAPTFFYANGGSVDSNPNSHVPFSPFPTSNQSQESLPSKFVYANGTPDLRPSPPSNTSRPGSVVSVSSKAPASRPGTSSQGSNYPLGQRPGSPVKITQQPSLASVRSANLPQLAAARTQIGSPPQLGVMPALHRTSTGTSRGSHSRTGSLVTVESVARSSQISSEPSSPTAFTAPQLPPLSLASIIQAAEDFGEDDDASSQHDSRSELQSPTKSTHSSDPISELVANARRERKVQDLEITNASLEAINRTLERQLRKQTSELRRYRRLSRAGRLSMASTVSNRVISDPLLSEDVNGLALSDLSEQNSDIEEQEEDDSFSDSDSASESLSPSLIAQQDARHRKRDEKRLRIDLSKHQELLIDSQKINQSIKRCLDWTEELIKEGKKALEYQVRVSDVEIPAPRVLNPVDEEDELTQQSLNFDAEASPEDTATLSDKPPAPALPRLAGWESEPQDRGSMEDHPGDVG